MWGIDGHSCIRTYNTKRAIEMLKELIEKYGIKVFNFVDDNFVPAKSRAIEICNFLSNYDVHFFCYGRADYVNDEILQALKKAGCHTINIGIESGNQRVLDFLNKRLTVQQNIEAIKCCQRNGITLDASFMIGITTETEDELKDTVNLIKTYKPDLVEASMFSPMPGTRLFDYCIEKGFFKKPEKLEDWAEWAGDMISIYHNTSNIPDKVLNETIKKVWMVGFYRNKFKRLFYWIKARQYKYIFKSVRRIFEIRTGVFQIPGLGVISDLSKKKPAPNPSQNL